MRSFDELKSLPSFPGVYAFKGLNDRKDEYSYVGMTGNLKERVSQHLIKRDSSVVTGASAVALNPDKISECHWWVHEKFEDRDNLSAGEIIAFEILKPTLRSRGSSIKQEIEKGFKAEMVALFEGVPSGYAIFYDIEWAVKKIKELEKEIDFLKNK